MAKKTSRTREARQRRQRQRRKNKRVILLAAIIVVAVMAIAVVIVFNQPVEAIIPDDLSTRYEGLQRSYTRDGYPSLGDPDAPVTLEEYASFACPGCEAFHSDSFDAILERAKDLQVLFTYVPLQTGSVPNASGASRAALCAGEQGMFWEMHDVLFEWHTRYGNTAFSQNRLLSGVEQLGMDSAAFTSCFNSADISAILTAATNEDVSTTPSFRVNGVTLESGGTIPSAATILQAIDDATPDDWGLDESDLEAEPLADDAALEVTADDTETLADQDAEQPPADAESSDTPDPTVEPESSDNREDPIADPTSEITEATEATDEGAQADS